MLGALASEAGLAPASIVVAPLDGRPQAVLDPERALYPASMIKVPLAAATLAEVEAGRLRLRDRHPVTAANLTANDLESPLVEGYEASLEALLHAAIARSDNVATNLLFDIVGRERATVLARERLGLPATRFARKLSGSDPLLPDPGWDGRSRNAHPASDAARLFAAIAAGEIPGAALLLGMLAAQAWNEKLSPGLAEGDRFAHKTGDTSEVTHDGGILETASGRRYAVVVYTGLPSTDANNARFAPFMRKVRERL